jgi:GNAT superfamily N-acetyltransferase/L-amino acid N-acyltransferase YncA
MQAKPEAMDALRHRDATIRSLREDEREDCLDLWCTVWPGEGSRAYFTRYFSGDIDWLPDYTQVAEVGGRIVSAVHICRRVVACGDLQLTMGGIANVATAPEFRGEGYSTACLRRAIAVMEADALDFSLLFTGINPFYAREGFVDWPRERQRGAIRADFTPRLSGLRVRPATNADLSAIQEIYAAYNRTRPIAVQRSAAYWRDWIEFAPGAMGEPPLLALNAEGRAVGYACYQVNFYRGHQINEDYAYVTEIGLSPDADPQAGAIALLDAIAQRSLASGKRKLHVSVALESAVCTALDGLLAHSEANVTFSGMARLLHRDNLLRSVTPELTDRWIAAGRPRGILNFDTPYGPTELDANGSFLRVQAVKGEIEHSDLLPQSALFGLLFGSLSPEEATEEQTLYPLLRALFPAFGTVFWGADGF